MRILFLIISILLTTLISAQNVEFKSANFKDDKEGLKKATNAIASGDEFLELGNQAVVDVNNLKDYFQKAIFYYEQANKFNPNNADLNYKLGNAYLYTNNKFKAKEFLDKSLKLNPAPEPKFYYYYAQALQLEGDYKGAIDNFNKFKLEAKSKRAEELKKFLNKYNKECKAAPEIVNNPLRVWIDNLETINSPQDDYSPCISTDGEVMLFTSSRKNGHSANEIGEYDHDIYSTQLVNGKWKSPKNVGAPLNTEHDETASGLAGLQADVWDGQY